MVQPAYKLILKSDLNTKGEVVKFFLNLAGEGVRMKWQWSHEVKPKV